MPPERRRKPGLSTSAPASPVGRPTIRRGVSPPLTQRHNPLADSPLPAAVAPSPQGRRQKAGGSSDSYNTHFYNSLLRKLGATPIEIINPPGETSTIETGVLLDVKKGGSGIPACEREYQLGDLDSRIFQKLQKKHEAANPTNKEKALRLARKDYSTYKHFKDDYLSKHPDTNLEVLKREFWRHYNKTQKERNELPFTPPPSPARPDGVPSVEALLRGDTEANSLRRRPTNQQNREGTSPAQASAAQTRRLSGSGSGRGRGSPARKSLEKPNLPQHYWHACSCPGAQQYE